MIKKSYLLIFSFLCIASVSLHAQNKQRLYTLKQGERIKTMECGMGVTNSADGYIVLVEKADMESMTPNESGRANFYAITPKKTYGPYIEPVINAYSNDGKYSATILTEGNADDPQNTQSYVLFNDGAMEGPFKGYANVTFSDDNTEWVITADYYDTKTDKSSTTLQFKGGKPIYSKKSEYIQYAPKGHFSARVSASGTAEGAYLSEYYFSDNTKYGPCEVRQFMFTEDGKGYGLLCSKAGQAYFVMNGKEKKVSENVINFQMSPDGSDWAVLVGNEDGSGYVEFANGKKSETYQYIGTGSLFYDYTQKGFAWVTGTPENDITVHFNNAKDLGPFHLSENIPLAPEGEEGSERTPFYMGAYASFTPAHDQWSLAINTNRSNCVLFKNASGAWEVSQTPSLFNNGFDGKGNLYFLIEKVLDPVNYVFEYQLVYPNLNKTIKLPEYPGGITFIAGTDKWYMELSSGDIMFNDKKTEKSAFAMRYDKKEKKLYWMSLEGQTIFLNDKAF